MAGVWFPAYPRRSPVAMTGPFQALPPHVVYRWRSTVRLIVSPVLVLGTACRAEVQHQDYLAQSQVDFYRICIACSPAAHQSSSSSHHFPRSFDAGCPPMAKATSSLPFCSDIRDPHFYLLLSDIIPSND